MALLVRFLLRIESHFKIVVIVQIGHLPLLLLRCVNVGDQSLRPRPNI